MKIEIKTDAKRTCNRTVENSDQICQLICDLFGYFLPRNKSIKVTTRYKGHNAKWDMHVMTIGDKAGVCELLEMIWKEWRFEDNEYEIL